MPCISTVLVAIVQQKLPPSSCRGFYDPPSYVLAAPNRRRRCRTRERCLALSVLGLSTIGRIRHVMLPGALPGYLAGLKQGWGLLLAFADGSRADHVLPGVGIGLGQLLNIGRELNQMELVITTITLILIVGIAINLLIFSPLERRVLRNRGLAVDRQGLVAV